MDNNTIIIILINYNNSNIINNTLLLIPCNIYTNIDRNVPMPKKTEVTHM